MTRFPGAPRGSYVNEAAEEPPIAGMWVIESAHELSPEIMETVNGRLLAAVASGEQVVVVEGIEFRWRPTRFDTAVIDTERLAEAIHAVGKAWFRESGEIEDRHIEANSDQLAADIAAHYNARLARGDNPLDGSETVTP